MVQQIDQMCASRTTAPPGARIASRPATKPERSGMCENVFAAVTSAARPLGSVTSPAVSARKEAPIALDSGVVAELGQVLG